MKKKWDKTEHLKIGFEDTGFWFCQQQHLSTSATWACVWILGEKGFAECLAERVALNISLLIAHFPTSQPVSMWVVVKENKHIGSSLLFPGTNVKVSFFLLLD